MSMSKGLRVYHKLDPPYSVLLESRNKDETIIFESGVIAILSAQQTEAIRRSYTKLVDAYGCLGVLNLPYARNTPVSYLVLVSSCVSVGKVNTADIYRISSVSITPLQTNTQDDSRIGELRKFLSSGTFYFSLSADPDCSFDLSVCAQNRGHSKHQDDRFFWNKTLHLPVRKFGIDCKTWLLKVMCGGVEVRTIYASQRQGRACLISRLNCERVGTRFNVRGVDDEGHVANFVETEQVIYMDDAVCSFIQVRGSVPLFWDQPGFQVGSHKVKMSRGYEASTSAFRRHLHMMEKLYGNQVIVNLLGSKESEQVLSSTFKKQHGLSEHYSQLVPFISFDYHYECRGGNLKNLSKLKNILSNYLDSYGLFFSHPSASLLENKQTGCMRVNCLDCLDRTNSVQSMTGLEVLQRQLQLLGLADKAQMKSRFEEVYKSMWSVNGDHLSRIYAGTGALGGGRSRAQDAARSANRTLQNNFLDSTKQEAIDLLIKGGCLEGVEMNDRILTLHPSPNLQLPIPVIQRALDSLSEYTSCSKIRISVGTWNVNGGKHFRSIAFKHEEVTDWLLDLPELTNKTNPELLLPGVDYTKPSDIFAIGFEEIVDLNAGNIVSASTQNQKDWGVHLQKSLSRKHRYVILTSVQLVGVCLFVYVRPRLARHLKNLAICSVKTGLGGTTGNKGGVAIRFQLFNSSLCFVCSHFAAGQSNVKERNNDFHDISNRISFPMNRKVWNHDHIFYCGDFNYRIDMIKDEVKEMVGLRDWSKLQSADQLTVQRLAGNVFLGFKEGSIAFAPTYKYDLFCDDYDTSEKCRVPAWTDRILWTSRMFKESAENACKLLFYHRSELKTSDHRPVLAIFEASVLKSKPGKRRAVLQRCLHEYGPSDCCVVVAVWKGEVGEMSGGVKEGEDFGGMSAEGEDGSVLEDEEVEKVLKVLEGAGDVVLVRFIWNNKMLVTFKTPSQALDSLQFHFLKDDSTCGYTLTVSVYDQTWLANKNAEVFNDERVLEDELMYGDDDEEDEDGDDEEEDGDGEEGEEEDVSESQKEDNLLLSFETEDQEVLSYTSSQKNPSGLSASSIDLTYSSPKHGSLSSSCHLSITPITRNAITPTLNPRHDVITMTTSSSMGTMNDIIVADDDNEDGVENLEDDNKYVGDDDDAKTESIEANLKPSKPKNVPCRPPPPKIKINSHKNKISSKIHIVKPFFRKSSKKIENIGIPTNVTKSSAKGVEEAEMLIGQLMSQQDVNQSIKPHPPLPSAPRPNGKQSSVDKSKLKQSTWYTAEKTSHPLTQVPPQSLPSFSSPPSSQDTSFYHIPSISQNPHPSHEPLSAKEPLLLLDHSDIPNATLHSSLDLFSSDAAFTPAPLTMNFQGEGQQDLTQDLFGALKFEESNEGTGNIQSVTADPDLRFGHPPQAAEVQGIPARSLVPCRLAPVLDRQSLLKQQQQQTYATSNFINNPPPAIPTRSYTSQQTCQQQPHLQSLVQLPQSLPLQSQLPTSLPEQPPIPQRQPPVPQRQLPQPLVPSRPPNIPPRRN